MENRNCSIDTRVVLEKERMKHLNPEIYKQMEATIKILEDMKRIGVLPEPTYNLALSGHVQRF